MCPSTDLEMAVEERSDSSKNKPLLMYVICIIYLCSGLKELFAAFLAGFLRWLYSVEAVMVELSKQPNYKQILESSKLLEQITYDRYVFLTFGGITQILAAFFLFKMRRRCLSFVIAGLVINVISPITHGLIYGWSYNFGKNGWHGYLVDWAFSFLVVYYLWRLQKEGRLKAT